MHSNKNICRQAGTVWRYQVSNQKPWIKKDTQNNNKKKPKKDTMIYKYFGFRRETINVHFTVFGFTRLGLDITIYLTSGAGTAYHSGATEFTPSFSGVRVTRTLLLYVCFVDRCLSSCTFSFRHCVVCSSLIYGFCLPLWYLQTLPITIVFTLYFINMF